MPGSRSIPHRLSAALALALSAAHGVDSVVFSGVPEGTVLEERDITQQVLPDAALAVLGAGNSTYCPLPCQFYHAGASPESLFVAQPLPSGVGDFAANASSMTAVEANCYPPYGVGPPFNEDWNVCLQQGVPVPFADTSTSASERQQHICQQLFSELDGQDLSSMPDGGPIGSRSSTEVTEGRWMKVKGDIGCGWGSTMSNVAPGPEGDYDWWMEEFGYQIQTHREQYYKGNEITSDYDCCLFAMSFEGTSFQEGGAAVRFQYSDRYNCRVNRETMVRGNLDRSGGLALKDTTTCGDGWMYWRHATGAADAANLKGETPCERRSKFQVLRGEMDALLPVGSLPDHFTGQWGNEFPNHACDKWPYGGCRGVIGYNTISSPEACCEACTTLKWIEKQGGDVSTIEVFDEATGTTKLVHANPCVAWQVVGGKCRILREQMVREYSRFAGGSVRDAILSGGSCSPGATGERNCNYYSFARFRETFEVTTPAPTPAPTRPPTRPPWSPPPYANSSTTTTTTTSRRVAGSTTGTPAVAVNHDVATFVKMMLLDVLNGSSPEEYLAAAAQGRHLVLDISAVISTLIGRGSSGRIDLIRAQALAEWAAGLLVDAQAPENAACATIRLYSSTDLEFFQDGSLSLPVGDVAPQPWCESNVCISGGVLHLQCNLTNFALQLPLEGRRLSGGEAPKVAMSFNSAGTGKESNFFSDVSVKALTVQGANITISGPSKRCVSVPRSILESMADVGYRAVRCS